MSKIMPVFIEDEKAIESFKKHNFSKELLKKIEEYLTIKLGIDIKFYESTDWPTSLAINTEDLNIRHIGVFSNIIESYYMRMIIYESKDFENKCSISLSFRYENSNNGGSNGNELNFYLIGDNKTNTLKEEKR